MPNNYIKPEQHVALSIAALVKHAMLPNFFTQINGNKFGNAKDDTLYWKGARVTTARDYEWRTRTAPIVLDKIGQTRVSITIDKHLYNAVPITLEERTLDIQNYATDVVLPQANAVKDRAEQKVVLGLRSANFKTVLPDVYENDDPHKFATSVRRLLNSQGTPMENRTIFAGAAVEDWLLTSDRVAPPAQGTAPEAVRNATLGRLSGMNIVPSQFLADDEFFVVVPSTLIVANAAPALPAGAAYKARMEHGGWSLLHTQDFDIMYQQDVTVLSTFMGVNSTNDELKTKKDSNGFTVLDLDANGDPQPTGKNVRGTKGKLKAGNRPAA